MSQEKLSGLVTLNIEYERTKDLDLEKLTKAFTNKRGHRNLLSM